MKYSIEFAKKILPKKLAIKFLPLSFAKNSIAMRPIIGTPARDDQFFPRDRELRKILRSLGNGESMQITAPRRVGKTSILWRLLDTKPAGRIYAYADTESIKDAQQFFKKILSEVLREPGVIASRGFLKAIGDKVSDAFKRIKGITVLGNSLELNQEVPDYAEELEAFLIAYAQGHETELVLLIDEFPITVENIKSNQEEEARNFLERNRAIRMNPALKKRVKFIYTGSIGLNYTVTKLQATATINDLKSVAVDPLTDEEAIELFRELLADGRLTAGDDANAAMIGFIGWLIPFHIQLLVEELRNNLANDTQVTPAHIEAAVTGMLNQSYQHHYEHYNSRLSTQFKGAELAYARDVLATVAQENVVSKNRLADLSAKHDLMDSYRHVLDSLEYDGYIHPSGTPVAYRFNSPIVQQYWLRRVI